MGLHLLHNKCNPKEIFSEAHKTKEGRRTSKQASTLRVDISSHTILELTKARAMKPTKAITLSAFISLFCHIRHICAGKVNMRHSVVLESVTDLLEPPTRFGCKLRTLHKGIYWTYHIVKIQIIGILKKTKNKQTNKQNNKNPNKQGVVCKYLLLLYTALLVYLLCGN